MNASAANIVFNGGFETGDLYGWFLVRASPGTLIFNAENGDYGLFSRSGNHALAGGSAYNPDTVYQILPTTAGQTYQISMFEAQLTFNQGGGLFDILWNGQLVGGQRGYADHGYEQFFATVTAIGNDVLGIALQNTAHFNLVDDIVVEEVTSVTATPEPATGALFGTVLAGLAAISAKRRNSVTMTLRSHVTRGDHGHSEAVGREPAGLD